MRKIAQWLKSGAKGRPHRRGTILIIVLWVAFGLVSITVHFGHSMMLEYRAAENAVAGLAAAQAIEGAARYAASVLANAEEPGRLPDLETYEPEAVALGDATFWLIGRSGNEASDDEYVFGLVDEASKLNLNTATREMLEALPTMTPELAGAILDWRDSDSELSEDGAESQNYLLRDSPYNCKDASFETVEELHLLIGGDWDVLVGEDANRNGVLEPNENDGDDTPPDDNRDGRLDAGVLEYFTVWSREPNKQEDGSDRINVRTTDTTQLSQYLDETLGEGRGSAILQGVGQNLSNVNSVLEFFMRAGVSEADAALIEGGLTASDGEYTTGLVNVNTASAAVLACLPGIGEDFAQQLVTYREGKTDELDTILWVTNVLDEEAAVQAGPYLTTRSYQFAADVAAVGRAGRGFRRELFVLDTSGDQPVVVYRRDRTSLGWPLGPDVREDLAAAVAQQGRIR